jgi:dTDP-4-amino-4,6-dideoxygalactose transaminase
MAALLLKIEPGDEVIMPSYTFVSTANAFALRGAKIVFADSTKNNPNINADSIEGLITSKTKAIVVVHYAGIACDMDVVMEIAKKHKLFVVEDAANAIDSYYKGKPLGSIGHLAAFSFHETKNIQCGEGGMLVINDKSLIKRAEIIREKGTNRSAFFRGEVDKYSWVDIGSSFLPSEMLAAFLYAQLEKLDYIQNERKRIWESYLKGLKKLEDEGFVKLPYIPIYASNNAHMFYLVCNTPDEREGLIDYLKSKEIQTVFHYLSLHKSTYFKEKHDGRNLIWSDWYTDRLVRLPLWVGLSDDNVEDIISCIKSFYNKE